ncbi:hypothetical protein [Catenuloplanes indicus]|uniref:Uncharacterized protein n=1 Tax=Catenuloplanes indicus TaxID=137267 RepID=A0AAE4AWF7_9ACTN|nr:hypothetical protein [Catenuloplanes indicus]MDQ0364984.1 hypothetical protein [Catenuloplanes indicus]
MALTLEAAAVVTAEARPYHRDEGLLVYHRDLAAPFDAEVREQRLAEGTNVTFTHLAELLLDRTPFPSRVPDMIIVSYALPDWYPFMTVAAHVDHLLGGGSRCFAVSEQGLCAPFTALRIASAYARSGRCDTMALLVLEQGTLPYHEPLVHDTPLADSGVLLRFGAAGGFHVHSVYAGLADEPLGTVLDRAVASMPAAGTLVVAGPWTNPGALAGRGPVLRVTAGSYCTSVWLELARQHELWAGQYRAVVLCDTDPRSGRSQAILLRADSHP